MALAFKKKESVRKGIKRLMRKRIEKALCALEHCERLEAVHEVRKEIKQMRALLRLVRGAIARADYRERTDALREAAGLLASARDARVKVGALSDLGSHFRAGLSPHSFAGIRSTLSAECREKQAELSRTHAAKKIARILNQLSGRVPRLKLESSGWAALEPGIKRSYRDGRRGYRLACQNGNSEDFHEWRKRVKDLLYQTGLLCGIWLEQMKALEAELKQLSELVGDDHDLFLLAEPATLKKFAKEAPREAETLKALIDARHKELQPQALTLGARFYQEKPGIFCQRLGQYWKRWRHKPKKLVGAH